VIQFTFYPKVPPHALRRLTNDQAAAIVLRIFTRKRQPIAGNPAQTRDLMILPRRTHLLYLVFIIPANTKYSINRPFIQMIERPPPENFDAPKPRPECLRIRIEIRNNARKSARLHTLPGHATNATSLYWNDSSAPVKRVFCLPGKLNILWVTGVDNGEKPASAFESALCKALLSLRFKWKQRP
jgi:hypothetical protein